MRWFPASPRARGALLLAALPWLNPFARGPSPSVMPWLVSAACGLALWAAAATGPVRTAPPRGLVAASAAVVAWAALSQLTFRPEILMLAAGLVLVLLAAGCARDPEIARGLQAGFLAAAAISALLGLAQYFGLSPRLAPLANLAPTGEAYANLRQPNQYATLCWIGGAVVLFGTLRLPRRVAGGLLVLLAAGCAASVSRTGLLQGLGLVVLAALWESPGRRERLRLGALAVAAYFVAAVALPVLLEATTGALPARTLWGRLGGGQACSSRLVLWSNVLHLVAQKPWAGWGWGELDFAHFDTLYGGPRFCDILDNAHNLPLHLAVELGVPLAALACVLALAWVLRQRPWREVDALRQLAWAVAALILLHSLLEYPLWYGPFQIAFGASLGWLAAAPPSAAGRRSHALSMAVACALGAAIVYAAWDYARISQVYLPPRERFAAWADDSLGYARRSWLFSGQAGFAELLLEVPDRSNAQGLYLLALEQLHYSPEPRVIERAIECATLLGREQDAVALLARYRAAFPQDYEAWRQARGIVPPAAR